MQLKIRKFQTEVISGADAAGLASALNAFYLSLDVDPSNEDRRDAELVSMLYVADFTVAITYTR